MSYNIFMKWLAYLGAAIAFFGGMLLSLRLEHYGQALGIRHVHDPLTLLGLTWGLAGPFALIKIRESKPATGQSWMNVIVLFTVPIVSCVADAVVFGDHLYVAHIRVTALNFMIGVLSFVLTWPLGKRLGEKAHASGTSIFKAPLS